MTGDSLLFRLRGLNLGARAVAPVVTAATPARGGRALPGAVERFAGGAVHVADWSAPDDEVHGGTALDGFESGRALAASAASRDPRFRSIDPRSWLFIDTETTSLNSGAGVWVFMVGLGWFEDDAFRVRQFLLTDPGAERALLAAVHDRVRQAGAIVSFHGKSFDAPRLDDRFRLTGLDAILGRCPHLDLLHPVRRLFGHRLPDCRLRTVEESLLRLRRIDDLPGALCPEAYFSYLRGRPHRLTEVFDHNRPDVLSLSALAGYLAAAYSTPGGLPSSLRAGLDWAEAGEADLAVRFLSAAALEPLAAPVSVGLAAARWLVRLGCAAVAERMLAGLAGSHPMDPRPGMALRRLERRARNGVAANEPGTSHRQGAPREASMQT